MVSKKSNNLTDIIAILKIRSELAVRKHREAMYDFNFEALKPMMLIKVFRKGRKTSTWGKNTVPRLLAH